jgi:hypothetical protein
MIGLLDPDERLIMPEDYIDNWTMYDQVCGSGWFITDENADDPTAIDFVWEIDVRRMKRNGHDMDKITVIDKVMVVRVRLPWSRVNTEWTMSEAELKEEREDVEVLDVCVRARRKDQPNSEPVLMLSNTDRRAYEAAPEEYEVTEKSYLVTWKMSPETRMWLRQEE